MTDLEERVAKVMAAAILAQPPRTRLCPKEKKQYGSIEAAKEAASKLAVACYKEGRRIKHATGPAPKREKFKTYICPECGSWHVGRGAKGSDADWNKRKVFLQR